jgi:Domain of unknown function (DUF1330)
LPVDTLKIDRSFRSRGPPGRTDRRWCPPLERFCAHCRRRTLSGARRVYERGLKQRTVLMLIEFDSVEQAVAAHHSPGYQAALAALGDGAERETRIVEGV